MEGVKKKKKLKPAPLVSPMVGWRTVPVSAPAKVEVKKKKKKKQAAVGVEVDADYSMASLLDQMGHDMRAGSSSSAAAPSPLKQQEAKAPEQQKLPGKKRAQEREGKGERPGRLLLSKEQLLPQDKEDGEKRKKKKRKVESKAGGADKEASAAVQQAVPSSSWGEASEWELWRPDVVAPLDDEDGGLNLDWAVRTKAMGAAAAAKLVVPRLDARVEVERLQAVKELLAWLTDRAPGLLRGGGMSLVAWLQGSKAGLAGGEGGDPVLPEGGQGAADVALGRALVQEAGLGPEQAAEVCEELGRRAAEAAARLRVMMAAAGGRRKKGAGRWEENGGPPVLRSRHHQPSLFVPLEGLRARLGLLQHNEAIDLSLLKGHHARINLQHYHKLKALYCPQHAVSQLDGRQQQSVLAEGSEEEAEFHERLGCLLFRYRSWVADEWWAGQRALPARLMDLLWERFHCRLECFSSPLTCRYPRYCSAFWDSDGFFGSVGPFWSFRPLQGCYVAHPPPIEAVVTAMTQHMCGLLSVTSRPLAFVVVLTLSPALSPAATKRLLQHNPHLCYRVVVRAGEHGFCLGSQHCQPRRHEREDRHDTVVLFLLSKAARASGRWEVSGEDEAALRAAFASFEQEDRRDRLGPPPPELFVKGPAISSSSSSQRRGREEQLEDDESMDGGDEEDGQED